MSRLAAVMKDQALAASATKKAAEIRAKLESEYYEPGGRFYAFSRNADGGLDGTASIYPAVAWWSGRLAPAQPGPMLDRWASAEFSTDWGTRDISDRTSFYDAISYHQGSVWPLFTGWVSLAEYRAGRAMAGYQHLMQNAGLTWAQDLGAVTELLSGAYFQPLGRSSSHQVWSSAMVLTPALRGLFGLDWDALNHTLRLSPKLPATWERALLKNVPLGTARWDVEFTRRRDQLLVRARSLTPEVLCLLAGDAPRGEECRAPAATERETTLPLPEVEVEPPHELPLPGSSTTQLKVTGERRAASRYEIDLEAPAGSIWEMPVRLSRPRVQVGGAELAGNVLRVRFGASASGKWERATVSFTW
jgi:hypothetical protein